MREEHEKRRSLNKNVYVGITDFFTYLEEQVLCEDC